MKNLHYLILLLILAVWIPSASISATTKFHFVVLSKYQKTISIGDEYTVLAATSNGNIPTWKSSNSKVATVNTYGRITAKKAGKAKITARIGKAEASCLITVRKTRVQLSTDNICIEHGETKRLKVYVSTNGEITYRSSRKSIASVNEAGVITGEKPGTTKITVTSDGTKAYCKVTVKKPVIQLSNTTLTMKVDETKRLHATTSSGLSVSYRCLKRSIADVDHDGSVLGLKKGTTYIQAKLDGVIKRCKVIVTK